MRRPLLPPGKAGLIMLAVIAAPILIKEAKPLGKAIVKGIKKLGEIVEGIFDQHEMDAKDKPKTETPKAETPKAEPTKAAAKPKAAPKPRTAKPKAATKPRAPKPKPAAG